MEEVIPSYREGHPEAPGNSLAYDSALLHSHFESIVFPQIKKALSAKEGRGFARHLQALEQANPHAYYDYSFQTVEYSDHGNLLQSTNLLLAI